LADVSQPLTGLVNPLIKFEPCGWTDQAELDFLLIRDMDGRELNFLRDGVLSGQFHLLKMSADRSCDGDIGPDYHTAGHVVWSIEIEQDGAFIIVVNAAGALPFRGLDVSVSMLDAFTILAKKSGARLIRFWTTRPGLVRKLTRRGMTQRYEMELVI
jgi:hypothetical protein